MTDPTPYLNPNNGERTSFPHAVSEYRPRTQAEIDNPSGLTLSAAMAAVTAACERAGVDGYDGEAVFYLDALLAVERGGDPDDAVRNSYGLDEAEGGQEPSVSLTTDENGVHALTAHSPFFPRDFDHEERVADRRAARRKLEEDFLEPYRLPQQGGDD